MEGIDTGAIASNYQARPAYDRAERVKSDKSEANSSSGEDRVSLFEQFANRVQQIFDKASAVNGASGPAYAEFSVKTRIEQTFEASYSKRNGGGNTQVSAYARESYTYEAKVSFQTKQAEQLAEAQVAALQGNQFGPEATASRIADFALSFFPMFAADNPDMSFNEQVDAYKSLVGNAIGEGFKEAMQILGALPNSVKDGIDETRNLVDQKINSFFDYLKGAGAKEGEEAANNGVWRDYVQEFFKSTTGV